MLGEVREGGTEVREIEQSDWTKLCGVQKSKEAAGGPAGRVREASTLVAGAAGVLAKIENQKLQGDAAESVLIGLAGAVLLSREASARMSVSR